MTRERIIELRNQLQQELQVMTNNLQATSGAIQILDKLLAEIEAETKHDSPA